MTLQDIQPFVDDAASTLLSKLSGIVLSTRYSKKEKVKRLEQISKDKLCRKHILEIQTRHKSLSMLSCGYYSRAYSLIMLWSVGQFFKYAYLKPKNAIRGRFHK